MVVVKYPFIELALEGARKEGMLSEKDGPIVLPETKWILKEVNEIAEKVLKSESGYTAFLPYVGIAAIAATKDPRFNRDFDEEKYEKEFKALALLGYMFERYSREFNFREIDLSPFLPSEIEIRGEWPNIAYIAGDAICEPKSMNLKLGSGRLAYSVISSYWECYDKKGEVIDWFIDYECADDAIKLDEFEVFPRAGDVLEETIYVLGENIENVESIEDLENAAEKVLSEYAYRLIEYKIRDTWREVKEIIIKEG